MLQFGRHYKDVHIGSCPDLKGKAVNFEHEQEECVVCQSKRCVGITGSGEESKHKIGAI